MKKILTILSLTICLSAFSQNDKAKDNLIIVRTYEVMSSLYPSRIVISYGNEVSETIELEVNKAKYWESNNNKIQYVFNKLEKSGYKVFNSTGAGGDGITINTYLLRKEK